MLVTSKEIFKQAQEGKYGILAPDFVDLDSARTYVQAAQKINQPIVLSYAQAHQEYLSLEEAALIGKYCAQSVNVPIVLHLDHGTDFDFIKQAINLGFTSVMIDASMDALEENIRRTREVVEYAHDRGVVVEAEIGHVGSGINYENHDQSDSIYTDIEEARLFVKKTQVDSLAVSIGTAHGVYKGKPSLNFEVLHQLREVLDIPLVLHGGSGSGDENLRKCAHEGIVKINIFTDFMLAAKKEVDQQQPTDYLSLKMYANQGMEKVMNHYLNLFKAEDNHE